MFQWIKLIICVLLCCLSAIVLAQSKEELQDKKEKLQNEIKLTNDLLNEAKKEKNASINTLSTLKRKIVARDEMISTLGIEIGLYAIRIQQLEQEVFVTEESITQSQAELQSLKPAPVNCLSCFTLSLSLINCVFKALVQFFEFLF